MPGPGSSSTARSWPAGSARRRRCSTRWSRRSAATSAPVRPCTPTTRRCRCWHPDLGQTKVGRLWVVVRDERPWDPTAPPAAFYRYSADRKGEHAQALLGSCRGFLHADAYAGFEKLYVADPGTAAPRLVEVACWAHARRYLYEVFDHTGSATAKVALETIGALFAIEREIKGRSPAERLAARQERSVPLLANLRQQFDDALARTSTKGKLAVAIRYSTARWPALTRYTTDGRLEICNNAAERAIRPWPSGAATGPSPAATPAAGAPPPSTPSSRRRR